MELLESLNIDKSLKRIVDLREENRLLYERLKGLIPDVTMIIVQAAYICDPVKARRIHSQILDRDAEIYKISRFITNAPMTEEEVREMDKCASGA